MKVSVLYGAGQTTYAKSLLKAGVGLTFDDAMKLAQKAIRLKKGKKNQDDLYEGGIDSDSFNAMYRFAMQNVPKLPCLGTTIPKALRPDVCGKSFMTSRMNFTIQSQGAEFLSALLTMIDYLAKLNEQEYHFILAIHDEVHFAVPDGDVDKFVQIMNAAHCFTWQLFHEAWGIEEFPLSRAYFDSVDVRHCMCKEYNESVATPSLPDGEPLGVTHKPTSIGIKLA